MLDSFRNNPKRTKAAMVAAVIIVFAVGVYYFFSYQYRASQQAADLRFSNDLIGAIDMLESGGASSTALAQAALADARNPGAEAQAKVVLGLCDMYIVRDVPAGMSLLKETALNEAYNSEMRVRAANDIASYFFLSGALFSSGGDMPAAMDAALSGAPWAANGSSSDLNSAVNGIYAWSDAISPTPRAEYGMAYAYAVQALAGTDNAKKTADISRVVTHIMKGDGLANQTSSDQSDIAQSDESTLDNTMKGLALADAHFAGGSIDGASVEEAFKGVIVTAAQYSASPFFKGREDFGRYYLAAFIARTSGLSRAGEIKSILAPLLTNLSPDFLVFLKNQEHAGSGGFSSRSHGSIALLARLDPDFASFLTSTANWQVSELR